MLDEPLVGSAVVMLLAVPGAAWLVGFEFAAGRQLPSAESGTMVRFLRASLGAHVVLSPASLLLVVWALRDAPGVDVIDGGVVTAALVPLLALAVVVGLYAAGPFLAGSRGRAASCAGAASGWAWRWSSGCAPEA